MMSLRPSLRSVASLLALSFGLSLAACGSSSSTGSPDLAMTPAPADMSMVAAPDLAMAATGDMAKPSGGNGDLGVVPMCSGPASCGGNPCCVVVQVQSVSMQMVQSISCAASKSDCAPKAVPSLAPPNTLTTRLCTVAADCTAGGVTTSFDECCEAQGFGGSAKVCSNSIVAALSGGAIKNCQK
jgi:hypothetical protein